MDPPRLRSTRKNYFNSAASDIRNNFARNFSRVQSRFVPLFDVDRKKRLVLRRCDHFPLLSPLIFVHLSSSSLSSVPPLSCSVRNLTFHYAMESTVAALSNSRVSELFRFSVFASRNTFMRGQMLAAPHTWKREREDGYR